MNVAKQFIIACIFILAFAKGIAQQSKKDATLAGVYLTHADFKAGKLTYDIDCIKEKQKIKLHDFFAKPYIDVYYRGEKHTLQKKDVYGYRDCKSNVFRFFENEEYQLAESGPLHIYFLQESAPYGKSFKWINIYYFSASPQGKIILLNKENLKLAFPDNHKFHDSLDEMFKSADISEFDTFHKMFKVNHLYQMAIK